MTDAGDQRPPLTARPLIAVLAVAGIIAAGLADTARRITR